MHLCARVIPSRSLAPILLFRGRSRTDSVRERYRPEGATERGGWQHRVSAWLPIGVKVRLLALIGVVAAVSVAGLTFWVARHAREDIDTHYRETMALLSELQRIEQ